MCVCLCLCVSFFVCVHFLFVTHSACTYTHHPPTRLNEPPHIHTHTPVYAGRALTSEGAYNPKP